ncbi:unnamed protein product [Adineta ricciae]|uniref:Uncharacterized protein n=1 Tax=Adineta ricciae TaxID=249248 RepID=A0A814G2P0_ADIRI|nr:unnamed protein product [Adineta ricciae]
MQELHLKYGWIPGAESIRPNAEIREKKENYIKNMLTRYVSLQDFILHKFFGLKPTVEGNCMNSKLHVLLAEISAAQAAGLQQPNHHQFRLVPNLFSYHVPAGTNHYVIWFLLHGNETRDPTTHSPLSYDEITASIEVGLKQLLGPTKDQFSFVWYPNPKPTIISDILYHVQVFWIPE